MSNAELKAAVERVRFQLGQADRFRAGLIRSGTWKPYIYEALDKQGLPRELAALPHVESSFDPTAYSKVGAAGMWQFMRSTGVRYMRIDHIVDERRDPFLATDGAVRLLAENYSNVETWPLALTAYNHGVAGMRRAVLQQNTTDIATIVRKYQSRSFQFASRNFYTAFLAALEIDTHPEKYFPGIKISEPSNTGVVVVPDVHDHRDARGRTEPARRHAARAEPRAHRQRLGRRQARTEGIQAPRPARDVCGRGRLARGDRREGAVRAAARRISSTACGAATRCPRSRPNTT